MTVNNNTLILFDIYATCLASRLTFVINALTSTVAIAIKHSVQDSLPSRFKPLFVIFDIQTL